MDGSFWNFECTSGVA